MITAATNWLLAFDNLSHLATWFSDALCRLSTGGAFGTRKLYTDDEEIFFEAKRPCILNGIEELARRADLLDRSLVVELPPIPPTHRKTEAEFWAEFDRARPRMLGAVLDAVSVALRRLEEVDLPTSPRMADFAKWVIAAEPALGLKDGEFMSAYERNRDAANALALESSPISPLIIELSEQDWQGTATELLKRLKTMAEFDRPEGFPKGARALSGLLRRLAPNFRVNGVDVEFFREAGGDRQKMIRVKTGTSPRNQSGTERDSGGTQEGRKTAPSTNGRKHVKSRAKPRKRGPRGATGRKSCKKGK